MLNLEPHKRLHNTQIKIGAQKIMNNRVMRGSYGEKAGISKYLYSLEKNENQKKMVWSYIKYLLLIAFVIYSFIWKSVSILSMGYTLNESYQTFSSLLEEKNRLRLVLARLKSPEQIKKKGEEKGFYLPKRLEIVSIPEIALPPTKFVEKSSFKTRLFTMLKNTFGEGETQAREENKE